MNTPTTPVAVERRSQLTDAIRQHAAGAQTERLHPVRVRHAIECGKALAELQALLGRGTWGRWIQEQCGLNRMTANRYMRLASRTELLTPFMSIREAYLATGVIRDGDGEG